MIPHVTISVLRPESRVTGKLWRRVLLLCGVVVIFIYWILYEHLHTNVPPHTTPTKSSLKDLHSFTPHQDYHSVSIGVQSHVESDNTRLKDIKPGVVKKKTSVAIGMGISLKGIHAKHPSIHMYLQTLPFFSQLLPSFCRTASLGYRYDFYLAHDKDDSFFTKTEKVKIWNEIFAKIIQQHCKRLGDVGLNLVRCNHSGRPAWAQNDAMMVAHKDGRDFFYRVNDDSIMITPDWTSIFIKTLQKMRPPLVGVVGPKHSGGNTGILTYDFVHRTHIDIFGYHYPRAFPWWYADDWITMVYLPDRSTKLDNVHLKHTMSVGTRYMNRPKTRDFINGVINSTKAEKLERYLHQMQSPKRTTVAPLPNRRVKTPNSNIGLPLSTLPSQSGRTTSSPIRLPVSPLPPLPAKSRNIPNSTIDLTVPLLTPKSENTLKTSLGLGTTLLSSRITETSNDTVYPRLSPLPTDGEKTSNSTHSSQISLLLSKNEKSQNITMGLLESVQASPKVTAVAKPAQSVFYTKPTRAEKTAITFEPSKSRKNPGYIPSSYIHTRKPS